MAITIVAITVIVIFPTERQILAAASDWVAGTGSREAVRLAATREHAFGAINILLLLTAIVLGVVKPLLGQKQP